MPFSCSEKYGGTVWQDGAKDKNAETNVLKGIAASSGTGIRRDHGPGATHHHGVFHGSGRVDFLGRQIPELFCTVVALDAGGGNSVSDPTMRNYIPEYLKNTEAIRSSVKIRLVGGSTRRTFRRR